MVVLHEINPLSLIDDGRAFATIPTWVIASAAALWNLGSIIQWFLRPLFYWVYINIFKFRVKSGDEAAVCIQSVAALDLPSQRRYVDQLNNSNVPVVIAFAGNDPFIEVEISRELGAAFDTNREILCDTESHDTSIASRQLDELMRVDRCRCVSVLFQREGHFLQKHRAEFLVDAIRTMTQLRR